MLPFRCANAVTNEMKGDCEMLAERRWSDVNPARPGKLV